MYLKDYKPGQIVTASGFIMQVNYSDKPTWHSTELPASGYVTICPHDITFTVPSGFNAVAAEVTAIDKALTEAADTYHQTVANLRDRKQHLLQLSYVDGEVLDAPEASAPPQTFTEIYNDKLL